MKGDTFIIH